MKKYTIFILCAMALAGCNKPSKVEQYHAEKHKRDSIALIEQERSLTYYQAQLDSMLPQADSLITMFKYEKNEKYQDNGYYVVNNEKLKTKSYGLGVMVRDDGRDLAVYREGQRLSDEQVSKLKIDGNEAVLCAEHLQIVVRDIKELEKRIAKTSLEIQKYQKRLQK